LRIVIQRMKALADPARLRLVALLIQGELCVCQLEAALNLSQTNVSRHLAVLRQGDIVTDRREGRWVYYGLKDPMETELRAIIDAVMRDMVNDPTIREDRIRADDVRCLRPDEIVAVPVQA